MKIKWNEKYTSISAYVVIVFSICYGIYKITDNITVNQTIYSTIISALVPFFIAFMISYFLYPLVDLFEEKLFLKLKNQKYKRFLSILCSYLLVAGLSVLLLSFIIPQILQSIRDVTRLIQQLNNYVPEIEKMLQSQNVRLFNTSIYLDLSLFNRYLRDNINIKETLNSISDVISGVIPTLISLLSRFASGFLNVVLGFIVAVYILYSKEAFAQSAKRFVRSLFSKKGADEILQLMTESHTIFNGFIIGSLIDALIITILTFILMLIFKIDYALLISIIVGITNLIPYFGPIIGGAIGFALLIFVNPVKALTFAVLILFIQQFDGNFLKPKIFGQSVGLGPIWVIFSIFLFGKLFGFVGMFLGVPIFTIFKNMIDRHLRRQYEKKYPNGMDGEDVSPLPDILPYDIHNREKLNFKFKIRHWPRKKK
ncbi:AI-2E family transporter [Clostridiales bacterium COT073_COT-073]|nr:AI-2E family transporter [Clostridiales bacterium COT073_COT-073]